MQEECLTSLLGIEGYRIADIGERNGVAIVQLERTHTDYTCGRCGRVVSAGYDHTTEELHHLMLWHHQTILRFERYRLKCPECGVKTEAIEFADIRGPRVADLKALPARRSLSGKPHCANLISNVFQIPVLA